MVSHHHILVKLFDCLDLTILIINSECLKPILKKIYSSAYRDALRVRCKEVQVQLRQSFIPVMRWHRYQPNHFTIQLQPVYLTSGHFVYNNSNQTRFHQFVPSDHSGQTPDSKSTITPCTRVNAMTRKEKQRKPRRKQTIHIAYTILAGTRLKDNLRCVFWMTLAWTVGTLEFGALAQSHERFLSDNVPTGHHHRWIFIGSLFFRYGTDENRVEEIGWWKRDLDLIKED